MVTFVHIVCKLFVNIVVIHYDANGESGDQFIEKSPRVALHHHPPHTLVHWKPSSNKVHLHER